MWAFFSKLSTAVIVGLQTHQLGWGLATFTFLVALHEMRR